MDRKPGQILATKLEENQRSRKVVMATTNLETTAGCWCSPAEAFPLRTSGDRGRIARNQPAFRKRQKQRSAADVVACHGSSRDCLSFRRTTRSARHPAPQSNQSNRRRVLATQLLLRLSHPRTCPPSLTWPKLLCRARCNSTALHSRYSES